MPELVRLYIRNVAIGFAIAVAFVAMLLVANVGNLQHLIFHTQGGWLALFMLVFFNGLVFAGVQFAIAVMRMAEPEDGGGKGLAQAARETFDTLGAPARIREPVRTRD